jgi:hypothetical protein
MLPLEMQVHRRHEGCLPIWRAVIWTRAPPVPLEEWWQVAVRPGALPSLKGSADGTGGSAEVADWGEDDPQRTQDRTERGEEHGVLNPENGRQRAADQDAEGMYPSFQDMHAGIHPPEQRVRGDRLAQTGSCALLVVSRALGL